MVKAKKALQPASNDVNVEKLAIKWSNLKKVAPYDASLVQQIYSTFLAPNVVSNDETKHAFDVLEATKYLEHYLWTHFNTERSNESLVLSILTLAIEKTSFEWVVVDGNEKFAVFIEALFQLKMTTDTLSMREQGRILHFLAQGISHLEISHVAKTMLKYTSLPVWKHLSDIQRSNLFKEHPKLKRHWQNRQTISTSPVAKKRKVDVKVFDLEADFYPHLLRDLKNALEILPDEDVHGDFVYYIAYALDFWIDLMSQLPTRRFLRALALHSHLLMACRHSEIVKAHSFLLKQVDLLHFYIHFPIDDQTGHAWTLTEHKNELAARAHAFQVAAFAADPALHALSLLPLSSLSNKKVLETQLSLIPEEKLYPFAISVGLVQSSDENVDLVGCFMDRFAPISPPALTELPRFPIETDIWASDETDLPKGLVCTRKLQLQFLSFTDYLYRNFELTRLEAAHCIRHDLEKVIGALDASSSTGSRAVLRRRHKMAAAIESIRVVRVDQPSIGELHPAQVIAQITLDLPSEMIPLWNCVQTNEVVFLAWLNPTIDSATDTSALNFAESHGVHGVRGAHVLQVLDGHGTVIGETLEDGSVSAGRGSRRVLRVALDGVQYAKDIAAGAADVLTHVNVVIRRDPKVNTFKAILDGIHGILRDQKGHKVLPPWLEDVFLGYGDPAAAHYTRVEPNSTIPLFDTFVDGVQALESFKEAVSLVDAKSKAPIKDPAAAFAPFNLSEIDGKLTLSASISPSNSVPTSTLRFITSQIEAIRSGMHRGLTVVAGPPGTGKTDTAVQLVSNLYRAHPDQRIVVVAHSTAAVQDFFSKLVARGVVDAGHLLCLGEHSAFTDADYTKDGRISFLLARRLILLEQVEHLANALGDAASRCGSSHSCAQAQYFFTNFLKDALLAEEKDLIDSLHKVCHTTSAVELKTYLHRLFKELEDLSALEVLRTPKQRGDFLLIKHARVIAMTCNEVALNRERFLTLGFRYNTLIMEEAAQVNEIESLLPMLLQRNVHTELHRVVLFGDHQDLPPIVHHPQLRQSAHLNQSLFTRLVRLGAPVVHLDQQGRTRPSIAALFQWKYKELGNLGHVETQSQFQAANAGFRHTCQFIDVPGGSEISPRPHQYENHLEAMYLVQLFQYMRRIGYESDRITILATYAAQKELLQSMFKPGTTEFGLPRAIATVDEYQGQQNDFILLSLVRTRRLGYLRDPRRTVVAVSRAKFGLYVVGKQALFSSSVELAPILSPLVEKGTALELLPSERVGKIKRLEKDQVKTVEVVSNVQHMSEIVTKLKA